MGVSPQIMAAVEAACQSEARAVALFEAYRWRGKPRCPRCQAPVVYRMKSKDGGRESHFRWMCKACRGQFSVRTGTILEHTRIPMSAYAKIVQLCLVAEKPVTAHYIAAVAGINYRSAACVVSRAFRSLGARPRKTRACRVAESKPITKAKEVTTWNQANWSLIAATGVAASAAVKASPPHWSRYALPKISSR